jgi:hypothetical protein
LVFDFIITIAPSYILSQIELKAKGYGLKHSITNLMNQPSYTLDAITILKIYQPREGSVAFGVQTKLEALLLAHLIH